MCVCAWLCGLGQRLWLCYACPSVKLVVWVLAPLFTTQDKALGPDGLKEAE